MVGQVLALSPSQAAPSRCSAYRPVEPGEDSYSQQKERAVKAPVLKVTEKATSKNPLVIGYEHGPSAYALYDPVIEDTRFFNIQIDTKAKDADLTVRQEWNWPSPSDFDLLLFGSHGERVADSQNLSLLPGADPWHPDAGSGFETIKGFSVERCDGYTIESKPFLTPGAEVRLLIWLD